MALLLSARQIPALSRSRAWKAEGECEGVITLMAVICSGVGPLRTVGSGTAAISSSPAGVSASTRPSPGSKVLSAVSASGSVSNSRCASSLSCWATMGAYQAGLTTIAALESVSLLEFIINPAFP